MSGATRTRLTAAELHARAVDLGNRREYVRAKALLRDAEQRTEDPALLARITGTRAFVLAQTGDAEGAVAMCLAALRAPGLPADARAILAGQLGVLATHRGDLSDANRWLTRAIDALADDPVARAHAHMNRSVVAMQGGNLSAALADLHAAEETYADHGRAIYAARARHNRGYVTMLSGDLVGALAHMEAARPALAADSPMSAAISDTDRAEVLREAGLSSEAEELLAETARQFGARRMATARAEAEFALARSLLAHAPERAAQVAAASFRRFRAAGSAAWAARADALRLRARLRAKGPAPSDAAVRAAIDRLRGHRYAAEATMLELTWAIRAAAAGRPPRGRLPTRPSAGLELQLLLHEARATRSFARGDLRAARAHAAAGVYALSEWQQSFGAFDVHASLIVHGQGVLIAGLSAALAYGDPSTVLEWSENARIMSQHVVPLRPPPDPELAEMLASLRARRAELPEREWAHDEAITDLRRRLRERQWNAAGVVTSRRHASRDDVRTALGADTAAIVFVYDRRSLAVLVLTDTDEGVVHLDRETVARLLPGLRADLEAAADIAPSSLARAVHASLRSRLSQASDLLLTPVMSTIGGRPKVVITAPGLLGGMPWTLLPGLAERSVTLPRSLSHWVASRGTSDPSARVGVAVGPGTARGKEESAAVASAWSSARILADEGATVDAVTSLAGEVDVLHVIAHGRHSGASPLFSALDLHDGALFGYDLDRLTSVPPTVILSACEVGRVSLSAGEETIGMARAWLHAGARSVIATPVAVADADACALLPTLHAGLAAGHAPSVALSAAAKHTGVRAPFQVYGSGF